MIASIAFFVIAFFLAMWATKAITAKMGGGA